MKFENSLNINSKIFGTINFKSNTVLTVNEFKVYCDELEKFLNILEERIKELFNEELTIKDDGEMYVTPPSNENIQIELNNLFNKTKEEIISILSNIK